MTDKPFPPVFATNRPSTGETVAEEVNRLLAGLRERLRDAPSVAIATAYLNPQGFAVLADELEKAPRVRLLIGAEPQQPEERYLSRRPTDADLLAKALADHEAGLLDERDLAGFTLARDTAERRLVAWLEASEPDGTERVEVRRYRNGFLHGKAYIAESDIGGVLAGSSNLTYAGLMKNRELNLGYPTGEHVRLVREWFEELWEESEPYDLVEFYQERFLLHDPWTVFLRILVALYGYPDDADRGDQPVLRLTGFQRDGIARMRRIVDTWGGVLVADEVGLGKTFLAGELIAEATQRDRQRALIIVPAALRESTWIPFLKAWDLISARVEVMSYDQLRLADDEKLRSLDEYALVVIDEAHNLRNVATQRSEAVRRLLSGRYPKQLVLLTATPVNNALIELHTLIGYFVRNDAAFASLGIPSLRNYILDAQAQDPESLSPAHLFTVLDQVAIRRTRGFIKRHYAGATIRQPDGREIPIEFPTPRVHRIDYELDTDGQELLERVLRALRPIDSDDALWAPGTAPVKGHLSMARYVPSRFELAGNVDLTQVVNSGFLRSALLKRLESSPRALANTLAVMIHNHTEFLHALDEGKVLRGRTLTDWAESGDQSLDDFLQELSEDAQEAVSNASNYRAQELRAAVIADLELLSELRDLADHVAAGDDAKASRLIEELARIAEDASRPSANPWLSEADRRKVVVFSGFADTIEDLSPRVTAAVAAALPGTPLARFRDRIAPPVFGRKQGIDQGSRARIIERFAPETSGALRDDGTPEQPDLFDILLTTDVLAEGVNLQQAGRVINYDLPWNPMRLVQRHGRIDRIGSKHREIQLGCFFPASGLDELLRLEETIHRKIAYAAVSIGVGMVIPGQRTRRMERDFAETREQIEKLREEQPELFETGGDSAAVSGEEFRRRLELALEDGAVLAKVRRLPAASGTGFRSITATEPGWAVAMIVGKESRPFVRFVSATPDWAVKRDESGEPFVDDQLLRALVDADPGGAGVAADLPDAAYHGMFEAWEVARRSVFVDWSLLTDPANMQPAVSRVLRRAADLVRDTRSTLSVEDRDRVAVALAQRWPYRIARDVGAILHGEGGTAEERVLVLRQLVDDEGLEPPPPPLPLPPITEEDIRLVAWVAVTPAMDATAPKAPQ